MAIFLSVQCINLLVDEVENFYGVGNGDVAVAVARHIARRERVAFEQSLFINVVKDLHGNRTSLQIRYKNSQNQLLLGPLTK